MKSHYLIALAASLTTVLALAAAPAPLSPNWHAGGPQNDKFLAGVDPTTDGHDAQFLLNKAGDPNAVGVLSQGIAAQPYLGQRVRFRARLRTRDLSNWGGLWMRVDGSDGKRLAFYNSQDKPIKGTAEWQERSVVLDVPANAAWILVGVIGAGTGQIWMEPLAFETVGREVPVDDFMAPAAGALPPALAREVASKTVELVESRGLYPRRRDEYDRAKAELLALIDGPAGDIDRRELYARIQKLLLTLDVDGHSRIRPPAPPSSGQGQGRAPGDPYAPVFSLVTTSHGKVLHWVPPPITETSDAAFAAYLKRFHDEAAGHPDLGQACALVVDLSGQTGGNAWPQMIAMHPLFSDANKAKFVDRDGRRRPVFTRAQLDAMNRRYADGRANPLDAFAGGPVTVLVSERTVSAGEMILVSLLGEDRVQTFGRTSAGMSTANATFPLADGSTLVLTTSRYALGDGPVYRGGIAPMHRDFPGDAWDASVRRAAAWAAANSPRCKAE
jgi:hypothetical protein